MEYCEFAVRAIRIRAPEGGGGGSGKCVVDVSLPCATDWGDLNASFINVNGQWGGWMIKQKQR